MPRFPDIDQVKKQMGEEIQSEFKVLQGMSDHDLLALIAVIVLQDKRHLVTPDDFRR